MIDIQVYILFYRHIQVFYMDICSLCTGEQAFIILLLPNMCFVGSTENGT